MTEPAFEDAFRPLLALVVDDGPARRRLIGDMLRTMRYEVHEVASGAEALSIFAATRIDFVIAGWSLSGMSSGELFRALRRQERQTRCCILAVAPAATVDAATDALAAGANDVLDWPARPAALRARLQAGRRTALMHEEFRDRTEQLDEACRRLDDMDALRARELRAAGRFHAASFPPAPARCGRFDISMAHAPAGPAGGDLVGYRQIGPGILGVHLVDVSGRGVATTLMAAQVGRLLGAAPCAASGHGRGHADDPAGAASGLNRHLFDDLECDLYLTAGIARLDGETGAGRYCSAGPVPALILRADSGVEILEAGGLPAGLCDEPGYESTAFHLAPGDALLMVSDGVTGAVSGEEQSDGADCLADIVRGLSGDCARLPDCLIAEARARSGSAGLADDASAILVRRT